MPNTTLYDCVICCGELDPDRYGHYIHNELFKREIVKHNVTREEVDEWLGSPECMKRVYELEDIGANRFGEYWHDKYSVCFFCTSAHKD